MIPPIFCISLARAADRRLRMAGHMRDLGLRCEMIDAVDGKFVSAADHRIFVEDEFWRVHRGRRLSPGEVGCFLSHYRLWQKIFVQKIPRALVLEDDAVLDSDIGDIVARVMECEAEWDVVILHAKKSYAHDVVCPLGGGRDLVRFRRRVGQTVAYLITDKAAEKLVDYCTPLRAPVDWLCAEWWRNGLKYYGVSPAAARHDREESTIQVLPKCPRSSGEHFSALRYRFADWNLRRRMLGEAKQQTKKEQQ